MKEGADDVAFVRAILDDLPRFVAVDEQRVYATGFSNGGMLTHRLGCVLSDRLAAIAPVSGPVCVAMCRPARPVPVMHIHGTADENAPHNGGNGAHALTDTDFRSVAESMKIWRTANRAVATPEVKSEGAVSTTRWAPGPGGAEVVLVTVTGQGHRWPGGDGLLPDKMVGSDVGAMVATDVIWEFLERPRLGER